MIGQFVARFRAAASGLRRVTLYHLVESQIADRAVTRCGRQMGSIAGTELAYADAPAVGEICSGCKAEG